ncbi:hypothetical protein C4K00_1158 [Pseudomonas synxantha]|uniref:TauD/TfdA family dioxygenase n=1 Tax=Pseudomonas TaxID=286 RepID=UPI000F581407|nr:MULTISPECIES: TauD/TfdA family dioxygenase [Pseudomonas]AZE71403.1 hypothetical protein C4K00_1158 [Pseudomonas synxantha]AZE76967.1 hypothetical protein C4J99_1166 [Pseudomonas synxantha]MBV4478603.1 TauD/TfdA family dioxygenase [Pseudomonas khavaziana]
MILTKLDYSLLRPEAIVAQFKEDFSFSSDITLLSLPKVNEQRPTPKHWKDDCRSNYDDLFLQLSRHVGDVFGYSDLQDGKLVQEIFPIFKDRNKQLGSGSVHLELHTEDPALPYRADVLGFLCVRNEDKIPNLLSCPDFSAVDATLKNRLIESRYTILSDRPSTIDYKPKDLETAVLHESPTEGYRFIYDPVYIDYNKMSQREELDFKDFIELVESATIELSMNEAQVLFINNYKCAHGRPQFTPKYDGTDRWLKRVQISKDVSKHLEREYSLDIITDI